MRGSARSAQATFYEQIDKDRDAGIADFLTNTLTVGVGQRYDVCLSCMTGSRRQ
jgi:hypothetical protein